MEDQTKTKLQGDIYNVLADKDDFCEATDEINNIIDIFFDEENEKLRKEREEHMNDIRILTAKMNDSAKEANRQAKIANDIQEKYEKREKERQIEKENEKKIRDNLCKLRQFMNGQFPKQWDKLSQSDRDNFDKQFSDKSIDVSIVRRKKLLDNNNGVKYAVLIWNGLVSSEIAKETAKYYLDLNDRFHPEIQPERVEIHKCVMELKAIHADVSISLKVLENLDMLCMK